MRKAIILAALLASAGAARAETDRRQFGNLVYAPPAGWTAGRQEDGVLTYLSDLPDDACDYCYIYLSTSLTDGTDPVRAIARRGLRFIDEADRAGVKPLGAADTFLVGTLPAAMQGFRDGGGDILVVLAVGLSDRVEMVGFQGDADPDEIEATMAVFQSTVLPLVESFAFVSEGAKPLMPAPVPGDLSGVWWGWNTYTTFGMDMMMRQDMAYRTLVFWPDGRFFDGMPPEGLSNAPDFAPLVSGGRTDFGTYVRDGDSLTLTFASGEAETLTAEEAGWNDGTRTLHPAEPLPDGTPLDGRISSVYFSGFAPGSGTSGGISSSSETVFSPDGTYTGSSFGGAFGSFDAGGGYSVGSEDAKAGTYAVRDGLLISTPKSGPPRAVLALKVGDGSIALGDQFLDTD